MLLKSAFNSFTGNENRLFGEMPLNDLPVNLKTPMYFSDYGPYGKFASFRIALEGNIMIPHLQEGFPVQFVNIFGDGCNKAT
ncbi:MAG: hypothetical protein ACYC1Q_11405 [Bacteroidia bacterium]